MLAKLPRSARLRQLAHDVEVLILQNGFLHLTLDDIASELKCSKATLYRLAASRDKLLESAIERWLARIRDRGWRDFAIGETWPAKLELYCRAAVTTIEEDRVAANFWADLDKFTSGYRALMDHQARRARGLDDIIERGIDAGAFVPVPTKLISRLMISSFRELVRPDLAAATGVSVGEAVSEWYRLLEFGLIRDGATAADARRHAGFGPA